MKPAEAIERLTQLSKPPEIIFHSDDIKAVQLGIEALDFFIEFQRVTGSHQDARLPSETKE